MNSIVNMCVIHHNIIMVNEREILSKLIGELVSSDTQFIVGEEHLAAFFPLMRFTLRETSPVIPNRKYVYTRVTPLLVDYIIFWPSR